MLMRKSNSVDAFYLASLFSLRSSISMCSTCRSAGSGEGLMDDRIGRVVATIGVDRAAAERADELIRLDAASHSRGRTTCMAGA